MNEDKCTGCDYHERVTYNGCAYCDGNKCEVEVRKNVLNEVYKSLERRRFDIDNAEYPFSIIEFIFNELQVCKTNR